MSDRLPSISGAEAVRAFERAGYHVLPGRGKGSHTCMRRDAPPSLITIPSHDPVRRGTLRALIRSAGLTVAQFNALL